MSKSALNFGAIGGIASMFGSMGGNPSINALTNANALAAQQAAASQVNAGAQAAAQPVGSGMIGDLSQNVMDASMPTFDPAAQMAGMGIFGAKGGRNRSLFPSAASAFMKKALGSEPNVDPCSEEFDYDVASDYGHSAEDIRKYREANCKSGSPAKSSKVRKAPPRKEGETLAQYRDRIQKIYTEEDAKKFSRSNLSSKK